MIVLFQHPAKYYIFSEIVVICFKFLVELWVQLI